jgi:hypothetical protein
MFNSSTIVALAGNVCINECWRGLYNPSDLHDQDNINPNDLH